MYVDTIVPNARRIEISFIPHRHTIGTVGSDGHGFNSRREPFFSPVGFQLNTSEIVRAGDENSDIKNEPPK